MKTYVALVIILSVFGSSAALAGHLYGTLSIQGQKLPTGVPIQVKCTSTYTGNTTPDSSYDISVQETGKCSFLVGLNGNTYVSHEVFSYNEPTRYDFELVSIGGQYILQRK